MKKAKKTTRKRAKRIPGSKKVDKPRKRLLRKAVQAALLGSSHMAWSDKAKRRYLSDLQRMTSSTRRELPLNLHRKSASEVFRILEGADPGYQVFMMHYKENNQFGRRELRIVDSPFQTPEEVLLLEKVTQTTEFSLDFTQNWGIVSTERENGSLRIDVAKTQHTQCPVHLSENDLKENLWRKLAETAQARANKQGTIRTCSVQLVVPSVAFVGLEVDTANGVVVISSTDPGIGEDGKRIATPEFEEEKRAAVSTALSALGMESESVDQFMRKLYAPQSNLLLMPGVADDIANLNDTFCIVVQTSNDYLVRNDFEESSEEVTSKRTKVRLPGLLETASEYFKEHGRLQGFFADHENFNPKNAKVNNQLAMDEDASQTGVVSYFLWARRKNSSENVPQRDIVEYGGQEWVIEATKFSIRDGELLIATKDCPKSVQHALRNEVYKIRPAAPAI